jgi:signal transduction histidine kinase
LLLPRQTGHERFLIEDLQEPLPELGAVGVEDQLLSPGDRRGGATLDQPLTLELVDHYQNYLAESSHERRIPIAGIQASAETLLRANPSRSTRKELIQQIQRQGHRVAGRAQIGALLRDFTGIQQIPITVQNGGYLESFVYCAW